MVGRADGLGTIRERRSSGAGANNGHGRSAAIPGGFSRHNRKMAAYGQLKLGAFLHQGKPGSFAALATGANRAKQEKHAPASDMQNYYGHLNRGWSTCPCCLACHYSIYPDSLSVPV